MFTPAGAQNPSFLLFPGVLTTGAVPTCSKGVPADLPRGPRPRSGWSCTAAVFIQRQRAATAGREESGQPGRTASPLCPTVATSLGPAEDVPLPWGQQTALEVRASRDTNRTPRLQEFRKRTTTRLKSPSGTVSLTLQQRTPGACGSSENRGPSIGRKSAFLPIVAVTEGSTGECWL